MRRFVLKGIAVSPGLSVGKSFHYKDILSRELEIYNLEQEEIEEEFHRIHKAMKKVEQDLTEMEKRVGRDISPDHAAIFKVYRFILNDRLLIDEIETELNKRKINAEHIIKDVFKRWERRFQSLKGDQAKVKSHDIADIGKQVLLALQGLEADILSVLPQDSVIFAKRLLTSDTLHLNKRKAKAIVTEEGSRNAHSALLARAMNIPSIVKINAELDTVPNGITVIVDGSTGEVIVNPCRRELDSVKKRIKSMKKSRGAGYLKKEEITINGKPVLVNANIASPEDARSARFYGCSGIGLYRIEQIYMTSRILPDENHLIQQVSKSLRHLKGMKITIRLLDIGSDKTLPYLRIEKEQNSILGLRGIRLLLKYPGLLETQLAALLKLSREYDMRILVPMISLSEEMIQVREFLENMKRKLKSEGVDYKSDIQLGAMIETPASVITIEEIIEQSDFLSIGTNDLIQYTMAADREKLVVSEYYDIGAEIILESIRQVLEKAKKAEIDCAVCGELAGDPNFTDKLVEIGLRNFSVSPHAIQSIKERLIGIIENYGSA